MSDSASTRPGPWISLWIVALLSLLAQLAYCQFFTFGERVPVSIDINPSTLWKLAYHFPPTGEFHVLNWLGQAFYPQNLQPFSLAAADLPTWWFFTTFAPLMATFALLAMAAFLREMEVPRPAALFGAVIYAWQGDILPFVFPGHYAYITMWPFFALAAWGALRCERTGHWAYAVISGAACGVMVGLPTNADRGGIACLLVGAFFLAAICRRRDPLQTMKDGLVAFGPPVVALGLALLPNRGAVAGAIVFVIYIVMVLRRPDIRLRVNNCLSVIWPLGLCVIVALIVALAPLLGLFKSNIQGVKIAGTADREQTYRLVTQFSLGPAESLTYLVPGFFGWHSSNPDGPYWGWIGESPDYPKNHQGSRNFNLAISTTGTIATVLAIFGVALLVWDGLLGPSRMTPRQLFYGRFLLALGAVALVLSWGWHTPFYRPLFALPMMDKWRNPLKWVEVVNFALVVLSAIGMQHLLASLGPESADVKIIRRRLGSFTLGFAILFGIGLAITYPLALILVPVLQTEDYDPQSVAAIMGTLHTSTLIAFVEMVLVCIILRCLWRPETLRRWKPVNPLVQRGWQTMLQSGNLPITLAVALAGLAALQLGWVANKFLEAIPLAQLTESNPLLDALRAEGDTVRFAMPAQDPVLNNLMQNQLEASKVSCVDVSAASRIPDDLNAFFQTLASEQAQMWFLAGVKNVVIPETGLQQMRQDAGVAANIDHAVGFTLAPTPSPDIPSHAMVTMKQYLAKATLIPDAEVLSSDDAVLDRLKDLKWNPWQSVLLHPGHSVPLIQPAPATRGRDEVGLVVYTPTAIEINVRSSRGGYVLVNDQYDPDWTAQVNGHDTELLRADYIMRAVQVPAGDSTVTMKYVAHYPIAGFNPSARAINNLSDFTLLFSLLAAAFALRRHYARSRESEDLIALAKT